MKLDSFEGQHVHLMLKHHIYFIGAQGEQIGPIPSAGSDDRPGAPITTDQIGGILKVVTDDHVQVHYPNPINQRETIIVCIETSNIAAAWVKSSIVAASAQDIASSG